MDVIRLSEFDYDLLCARFSEHDNSFRRMHGALDEATAVNPAERLVALRELERHFDIDLGSLCDRWSRRTRADTHPLERSVLEFMAEARAVDDAWELWIRVDRVQHVRDIMEDRLVPEPGS